MNKIISLIKKLSFLFILGLSFILAGCDKKEDCKQLESPIVNISNDGTITWNNVNNASYYVVEVDDKEVFRTDKYSYELDINKLGNYKINVKAIDDSNTYLSSISNSITYTINSLKVDTPVLEFNGNNVIWDNVNNADYYDVYVNSIRKTNVVINEQGDKRVLVLDNYEGGEYDIEVRARSNSDSYKDSDLSDSVCYVVNDTKTLWKQDDITNHYKEYNSYCIHHYSNEILVWVDSIGTEPVYFEDYITIPSDINAFNVYGYKPVEQGICNISVEMRLYDEEYETLTINSSVVLNANNESCSNNYFTIPAKYKNQNVYVRVKTESSGGYTAQYVIRAFSLEKNTTYIEPSVPVNSVVSLTSVTTNTKAIYNTDKGYMTYINDNTSDTNSVFKIVADTYKGEGYYRIIEPNGNYLTLTRLLRENNVVYDYVLATPYVAESLAQIWMIRPVSSIGGEDIFTILNYGYTDGTNTHGDTMYLVLAAPCDGFDHFGTWHDIEHTDLQFVIKKEDTSFNPTNSFIPSSLINFNDDVIVSFTGRNTTLVINNNNRLTMGELLTSINDLANYSWKFEKASDDYYYIKLNDGSYLSSIKDGITYHVTSGSLIANDSKFLWKLESRGGMFYYIGNKFVNDDCHMNAYIVRDSDGLVSFYTDLLNVADQILRIKNI